MSQTSEAVETAIAAQSLLGSQPVTFFFPRDTKGTSRKEESLTVPGNPETTLIALTGFNVAYTDEDYELKNLQVSLSVSGKTAACTATLRDRNDGTNAKEWGGSVEALVMYFG